MIYLSRESLNCEKCKGPYLEEIPACHGRVNLGQQSPSTPHTLHVLIFAPQAFMLL